VLRAISLKSRLRLTILLPLMAVAIGYSLLSLGTVAEVLFGDAADRAMLLASQAQTILVQRVTEYNEQMPPAPSMAATKERWTKLVGEDESLTKLLVNTMSSTRTVVAIHIQGEDGRVLNSSNPESVGRLVAGAIAMSEWQKQDRIWRVWRVLRQQEEYETIIPLGIPGQERPLFSVRVLVSSVLLRNTLIPEVRSLLIVLGVSLLLAFGLAILAGNLAFFPLRRLGEAIDKVSRGESLEDLRARESSEMKAVESKLSLLGEQVRGAKEDLKQMRGNVDQLLERMEDAVLLFDQEERLINAGPAVEKLLGKGRWELIGSLRPEIFPPSSAAGALLESAMTLKRRLHHAETILLDEAGAARPVVVDLEILSGFPAKDAQGYMLTIRDAEAKLNISKQLDVSQRLSALNRLTGGVAHEIKNPLNSIGLHLAVLEQRIAGQDPVASEELRVLREETRRLDRVVKTFLDFTKPIELRLEPLDLFELVNGLVQFLSNEAQTRSVDLKVSSESYPLMIRGDQDLLKQAFLNLLRNGMEAMPKGGIMEVQLSRENGSVAAVVADSGVGIAEENRSKIFQLYFTTKTQGSGIGLAVSYRVVQLHNGSIDFQSQPGVGTQFKLLFPALAEGRREEA
jgi:PAS domain S-box-containing protein